MPGIKSAVASNRSRGDSPACLICGLLHLTKRVDSIASINSCEVTFMKDTDLTFCNDDSDDSHLDDCCKQQATTGNKLSDRMHNILLWRSLSNLSLNQGRMQLQSRRTFPKPPCVAYLLKKTAETQMAIMSCSTKGVPIKDRTDTTRKCSFGGLPRMSTINRSRFIDSKSFSEQNLTSIGASQGQIGDRFMMAEWGSNRQIRWMDNAKRRPSGFEKQCGQHGRFFCSKCKTW